MAHKISLSIETVDPTRRNELIEALCDVLGEHLRNADEAKLTFTRKLKTAVSEREVKDTVVITQDTPVVYADLDEELRLSVAVPLDSLWGASTARTA